MPPTRLAQELQAPQAVVTAALASSPLYQLRWEGNRQLARLRPRGASSSSSSASPRREPAAANAVAARGRTVRSSAGGVAGEGGNAAAAAATAAPASSALEGPPTGEPDTGGPPAGPAATQGAMPPLVPPVPSLMPPAVQQLAVQRTPQESGLVPGWLHPTQWAAYTRWLDSHASQGVRRR